MHKLKSRPCRVLGNRDGEGGDEGTGQGCFPPPLAPRHLPKRLGSAPGRMRLHWGEGEQPLSPPLCPRMKKGDQGCDTLLPLLPDTGRFP